MVNSDLAGYSPNGSDLVAGSENGADDREDILHSHRLALIGLTSFRREQNVWPGLKPPRQPASRHGCFYEHSLSTSEASATFAFSTVPE